MSAPATQPLMQVENLTVRFTAGRGMFSRSRDCVHAVNGVSFDIAPGETLGLVGESGCGKSTLARAAIRLIKASSGKLIFRGRDIAGMGESELKEFRRHFQMIFQDPFGSLNPSLLVEDIIAEPLDIHGLAPNADRRREKVQALLASVGLDPSHRSRYPHEFSGGQRQRIGIARALALEPELLVCDEPVSALDVSVQAQIINLLRGMQAERGLAMLFIAHDLAVVEHISHRILVMYLGRVMESGPSRAVCQSPFHPYTQALISAIPTIDLGSRKSRLLLSGDVPSPIHPPSGCPFQTRCPRVLPICRMQMPGMREIEPGHHAACHLTQ